MTITMSYEEYNKMQEFAKQFVAKKGGKNLDDKQAHELIGKRAAEIAKKPAIQKIMANMIEDGHTKEEAEKWLYMVAVGSLCGK